MMGQVLFRPSSALLRSLTAAVACAVAAGAVAHPVFAPPATVYGSTFFAPIERFGPTVTLELVARGLVAPNKGVVAPGERDTLYVVDQSGQLWAVDLRNNDPATNRVKFLDVGTSGANLLVALGALGPNTFDERGLLGLAFHPNYRTNGRFYTYTSEPSAGAPTFPTTLPPGSPADHQNVVSEWTAVQPGNPAAGANPVRRVLMRVDWPQFNHDGGDLAFGPDGMLYISMGDGGGADDRDGQDFIGGPIVGHGPDGNGQKLTNPLGKILRIDVNGNNAANGQYGIPSDNPFVTRPGALREIYAFGFRNPFRFSFDTRTGRLFVGDVGQNDIEEVDEVVAGGNYGWSIKEGTLFFNANGNGEGFAQERPLGPVPAGLIEPIAQYDTHGEGHSVIGGFVYRGQRLKGMHGRYLFGDFSVLFKFPTGPHDYGRLFHLNPDRGGRSLRRISEFHIARGNRVNLAVLGMGQDAAGEIYVTGNVSGLPFGAGGFVVRIAPPPEDDHRHHDFDD